MTYLVFKAEVIRIEFFPVAACFLRSTAVCYYSVVNLLRSKSVLASECYEFFITVTGSILAIRYKQILSDCGKVIVTEAGVVGIFIPALYCEQKINKHLCGASFVFRVGLIGYGNTFSRGVITVNYE